MWTSPEEFKCSVLCGEPIVGPEWVPVASETEAGAGEWAGLRGASKVMRRTEEEEAAWTP